MSLPSNDSADPRHAAAAEFAARVERSGILPPGTEIIIDGPRLHRDTVAEAAQAAHRLLCALRELFEADFGASLTAFGRATGHSTQDLEVFQWEGGLYRPDVPTRVDAVLTEAGLKFVEFNIGSSVGGFEEASLRHLTGLPQSDVPLLAWGRYMAARIAPGSTGMLVDDAIALGEIRSGVETQARLLSACAGVHALVGSQHDCAWDGGTLRAAGRRLDWVYPLFFPSDVQADPLSYEPLKAAIRAGAVALPVPQAAKVFGSKLALALLHDKARAEPAQSPLRQLVERWVAWTVRFDDDGLSQALERQHDWVLKPALGLGGSGVVIGQEHSQASWRQALNAALAHPDRAHVLQRFHAPQRARVLSGSTTHGLRSHMARCIWGLHLLNGRSAGTPFLRCAADGGSGVINQCRGAAAGATPLLP